VYDGMKGVSSVESGYMGGRAANPTYEQVCGGDTGHAEVVRITFDPAIVSFKELLEVFFVIHDPTTLNRQGNDAGTQYRSAVFYHTPQQKADAGEVIARLDAAKLWGSPIVTELTPASTFYMAELSPGVLRAIPPALPPGGGRPRSPSFAAFPGTTQDVLSYVEGLTTNGPCTCNNSVMWLSYTGQRCGTHLPS
jgi:methionine-S-sulfoxide reductase